MASWKLKRTKQCRKCPWRKDVDPNDIPNGYDVEKHKALSRTIAEPGSLAPINAPVAHVMACHESHEDYCLGWLMNQLGLGNNIGLRIHAMSCENIRNVRLVGEQHERFEDTLPQR